MALVINGGVCCAGLMRPTSGIRQGCPLSPALFGMLVHVSHNPENTESGSQWYSWNLRCADDLMIISHGTPQSCILAVGACSEILSDFTYHVGLEVNRDESAFALKVE